MSSEHTGKGHALLRKAEKAMHMGRDKEQPPIPQPTVQMTLESDSHPSARRHRPTRSQTMDSPTPPAPAGQPLPTGIAPHVHPAATLAPTSGSREPTPVPRSREPTPAPAPAPSMAPTVVSKRRAERDEPNEYLQKIQSLEDERNYYKSDAYRRELVSIRTHLQVNDLKEPWQISQGFQAINRAIENVSRTLAEILITGHEPDVLCFTGDFLQLEPSSEMERSQGSPVEAEDFIDFSCRYLISRELQRRIFDDRIFHPALEEGVNRLLVKMYKDIRRRESQVIAGRWRVSSFNAHSDLSPNTEDLARSVCRGPILELCSRFSTPEEVQSALHKIFPEVVSIFTNAWQWSASTKSSVVMLDFHPFLYAPGMRFIPEGTSLEGKKLGSPASGSILLTTRMGLVSSEAQGGGVAPHEVVQVKATALTEEFFSR